MRTVGTAQFVGSIRIGVDKALLNSHTLFSNPTPLKITHRNSLSYVGPTHVYRIIAPDGTAWKIGQSALGKTAEEFSRRAEAQARRLSRESGQEYTSRILRDLDAKAPARALETRSIETYRKLFGPDALPGNKTTW